MIFKSFNIVLFYYPFWHQIYIFKIYKKETWKQPKNIEWINKLCYLHRKTYHIHHIAIDKNNLLIYATWGNHVEKMLSVISKTKVHTCCMILLTWNKHLVTQLLVIDISMVWDSLLGCWEFLYSDLWYYDMCVCIWLHACTHM